MTMHDDADEGRDERATGDLRDEAPFSSEPGPDGEPGAEGDERALRLTVTNPRGAIRVRGGDGDRIEVRARDRRGEPVPLDEVADVTREGSGEITVRVRPLPNLRRQMRRLREAVGSSGANVLNNLNDLLEAAGAIEGLAEGARAAAGRLDIEATVPRRCNLYLTSPDGPLEATGVAGEIHLQTARGPIRGGRLGGKLTARSASGEVELDGVDGAAFLQTASGDIKGARIRGNLLMQTASGDVVGRDIDGRLGFKSASGDLAIRESRLDGLYLNTASGDARIEAALAPGDYEARTVSGDVELRVQPGFSATLTGRTLSGTLRCAIPHRHPDDGVRDAAPGDEDDGDGPGEEPDEGGPFRAGGPRPFGVGIRIGPEGIDLPGLNVDEDGVSLPGLRIGKRGIEFDADAFGRARGRRERREGRRRGRNRWEFLLGDSPTAARDTRLRVRTVSGDLSIRTGRAAGERPAREEHTSADPFVWVAGDAPPPPAPPRPPREPLVPPTPSVSPLPPTPPPPPTPLGADMSRTAGELADVPAAPPAVGGAWPDSELWPPEEGTPTDAAADTHLEPTASTRAPASGHAGTTMGGTEGAVENMQEEKMPDVTTAPITDAPEVTDGREGGDIPADGATERERARLLILEAVQRKEITTDEALVLLQQVEG